MGAEVATAPNSKACLRYDHETQSRANTVKGQFETADAECLVAAARAELIGFLEAAEAQTAIANTAARPGAAEQENKLEVLLDLRRQVASSIPAGTLTCTMFRHLCAKKA